MIIRMARVHWRAELAAEAETLFSEGAIPILSRQIGFIRAQLLGAENETLRIALTAWENEICYEKFVSSEDMQTITKMFQAMYVDGALPIGTQFHVLRDSQK
jgi:heme-degrading monooxygenase HmoA